MTVLNPKNLNHKEKTYSASISNMLGDLKILLNTFYIIMKILPRDVFFMIDIVARL